MTDRMVACVETGKKAVVFEAWAWQGLYMYVDNLIEGKSGADLTRLQTLCALSLLPSGTEPNSGTSPNKTVGWMTYLTHNGSVEIAYVAEPDGTRSALITAEGIPDENNRPTIKKFTLPAAAAGA